MNLEREHPTRSRSPTYIVTFLYCKKIHFETGIDSANVVTFSRKVLNFPQLNVPVPVIVVSESDDLLSLKITDLDSEVRTLVGRGFQCLKVKNQKQK